MFLLERSPFEPAVEKRLRALSPYPIRHVAAANLTLYYEERPDLIVEQGECELTCLQDGSLLDRSEYENGDGLFTLLNVNTETGTIDISTDAINSRPVYYRTDHSAFSSHLLVLDPEDLDAEALSLFLYMSYNPLFTRTVYQDIHQTQAGTFHRFSNGELVTSRAPSSLFALVPSTEAIKESEFFDRLDELYTESARRALANRSRVHLQLSGGIDTRGLLSTALRHTNADIQTHGYGPEWFCDNVIARTVERKLPRVVHSAYGFDKGNDLLAAAEQTAFHSSLNTRLDDVFRNYIVASRMGQQHEPLFGTLVIDSLLGDETEPWMSSTRTFDETDPRHIARHLSFFDIRRAASAFEPPMLQALHRSLVRHYREFLPSGVSEVDGYDLLNMLVRHGKGTIGMIAGAGAYRPLVLPAIRRPMFQLAFALDKSVKTTARGYIDYLERFVFAREIEDIPTTRDLLAWRRDGDPRLIATPSAGAFDNQHETTAWGGLRDYFFVFREENAELRSFIADNVLAFDRRKLVPARFEPLLGDVAATRILTTVALVNNTLDRMRSRQRHPALADVG